MKAEKLLDTVKKTEERLSKIQVQGPGTTVEMNSLVTEVSNYPIIDFYSQFSLKKKNIFQAPNKRGTNDIWLKPSGNDSSEDEEGTEEQHKGNDEMEETDFKSFVDKRHEAQIEKAKNHRK